MGKKSGVSTLAIPVKVGQCRPCLSVRQIQSKADLGPVRPSKSQMWRYPKLTKGKHLSQPEAIQAGLFTTPALMKGLGNMLHTVVTTRTTRISGMLPADSRFTLDFAILWSRNMIRFSPRHHAKFYCLQPALLFLTSGPGPMAAVSVSIAQPPEVKV